MVSLWSLFRSWWSSCWRALSTGPAVASVDPLLRLGCPARRKPPVALPLGRVVPVPPAPNKAMNGDQARDVPQPGNERYRQEQDRGHPGEVNGYEVDIGGVVKTGDLVPKRVQPEPGLARIATGFV